MTRPWILFDGDDTLWQTQVLYDASRQTFALKLASESSASLKDIIAFQRQRSLELAREMGYARARFSIAMEETARHFLGHDQLKDWAHACGQSVFEKKAEPREGAEKLIQALLVHREIGLITAGDPEVQKKRIADFPLTSRFAATRIVEKKTPEIFRALSAEWGFDPATTWMVGDSLRSDVIPAHEAGLKAIHLAGYNWSAHEVAGHDLPPGAKRIRSLKELMPVLAAAE